jgi:hypothetical protein
MYKWSEEPRVVTAAAMLDEIRTLERGHAWVAKVENATSRNTKGVVTTVHCSKAQELRCTECNQKTLGTVVYSKKGAVSYRKGYHTQYKVVDPFPSLSGSWRQGNAQSTVSTDGGHFISQYNSHCESVPEDSASKNGKKRGGTESMLMRVFTCESIVVRRQMGYEYYWRYIGSNHSLHHTLHCDSAAGGSEAGASAEEEHTSEVECDEYTIGVSVRKVFDDQVGGSKYAGDIHSHLKHHNFSAANLIDTSATDLKAPNVFVSHWKQCRKPAAPTGRGFLVGYKMWQCMRKRVHMFPAEKLLWRVEHADKALPPDKCDPKLLNQTAIRLGLLQNQAPTPSPTPAVTSPVDPCVCMHDKKSDTAQGGAQSPHQSGRRRRLEGRRLGGLSFASSTAGFERAAMKLSAHHHERKGSDSTSDSTSGVSSDDGQLVHMSQSKAAFIEQLKREAAGYGAAGVGGARFVVDENVPTPQPTIPPPPSPAQLATCRPRGWDPQVHTHFLIVV